MAKASIAESKAKIQKQIEVFKVTLEHNSNSKDKKLYNQALDALKEGLKALEEVETTKGKGGRPKKAPTEKILELRHSGMTQEQISRELNLSISTVVRELRNEDKK